MVPLLAAEAPQIPTNLPALLPKSPQFGQNIPDSVPQGLLVPLEDARDPGARRAGGDHRGQRLR